MAPFDVLAPHDLRVQRRHFTTRGLTYSFLHGRPQPGPPRATIVLIHGWPDLSFGWRYQIPFLLKLGFEVVAPDLCGFGGTSAPAVPPNDLSLYSTKRASDDIAALASFLGAQRIILGGHDWGGAVVFRVALWHPGLVKGIFSVCTPYTAPNRTYLALDEVVARVKQFGYQKHLAGPHVEATVKEPHQIRAFLSGIYGAKTPLPFLDPNTGINLDLLSSVGTSPLVSDAEMDFYVEEYSRHGMHGPLNWYRTRKINWEEELSLEMSHIDAPVLFIAADKDTVLLPNMSRGMERHISRLTRRNVPAAHWALWQKPDAINSHIKEWLDRVLDGDSKL